VKLPFLDRHEEAARFRRLLDRPESALGVVYGRRRCGKSRLLREILPPDRSVYYVGDDREGSLQRASLATEIGRLLPGFERVTYPGWDDLLARWWQEARPRTVLALDEFPSLVAVAPELPSLLQKVLDRESERGIHLLLTGSSQRMMQGLVLDRTAPLFGRASEILKISPLPAGWIEEALDLQSPERAVEAYAVWGGTPRYWELAGDHPDLPTAIRSLVLSPLGVLFEEPSRLLLDDMRDTTQAASILSLIGQGCHRISEIAARLGKPVTALSRPLQRLQDMDLITREQPFGEDPRQQAHALQDFRSFFALLVSLRRDQPFPPRRRPDSGGGGGDRPTAGPSRRRDLGRAGARQRAAAPPRRENLGPGRPLVGARARPPAARGRSGGSQQ
jgi:AAA+ ATPase superfamily predicted ATPase